MKYKISKKTIREPGALMAVLKRSKNDISLIQFPIVAYLGIKEGLSWELFLLLIPLYAIYKLLDVYYFHGQEKSYEFRKNPYTKRQLKMIEDIHERIVK